MLRRRCENERRVAEARIVATVVVVVVVVISVRWQHGESCCRGWGARWRRLEGRVGHDVLKDARLLLLLLVLFEEEESGRWRLDYLIDEVVLDEVVDEYEELVVELLVVEQVEEIALRAGGDAQHAHVHGHCARVALFDNALHLAWTWKHATGLEELDRFAAHSCYFLLFGWWRC